MPHQVLKSPGASAGRHREKTASRRSSALAGTVRVDLVGSGQHGTAGHLLLQEGPAGAPASQLASGTASGTTTAGGELVALLVAGTSSGRHYGTGGTSSGTASGRH